MCSSDLIAKGKETRERMEAQMTSYNEVGYPEHNGLAETRVVIRRNTVAIERFNEMWWGEISAMSVRDQVSFNYSAWTTGVEWKGIDGWVPDHPWFNVDRHRGQ